jgi:hypothetical protein
MIQTREEPAKTEKGSRRWGYPAYVKIKKDVKHNFWYFDHVHEAHNHKLEPSARMTRYMHTHKHMEDDISDIFNIMTKNRVSHQAALNVMSDLCDGRHMWGFTEEDIKNLYMLFTLFSTDCSSNIYVIATWNISELQHVFLKMLCCMFLFWKWSHEGSKSKGRKRRWPEQASTILQRMLGEQRAFLLGCGCRSKI